MSQRFQQLTFLFILLAGFMFTSMSVHAETEKLKNIVILGDSLSDNGNLYRGNVEWWVPVPAYFIPKPPYHEGRFSNGPIWADHMEAAMQTKAIKTINYAAGGALLNWHVGIYLPYTLKHMMDRFFNLESWAGRLDDTLFIIWIGGNDYLRGVQYFSDIEKDTNYAIETLGTNLDELIAKGARHILLINLPDVSRVPRVTDPDTKKDLKLLSEMHNRKLATLTRDFTQFYLSKNVKIRVLDAYGMVEDILYDPVEFNKKHGTDLDIQYNNIPCWTGGFRLRHSIEKDTETLSENLQVAGITNFAENQIMTDAILASPDLYEAWSVSRQYTHHLASQCKNPDNYMFWDKIHPSSKMHTAIFAIVMEVMREHWGDVL